ncbi:UNVERIFIED_CONTAM: putative O-methyltransferase 3 [Sesamum calycinum]|uniref:O-methyltransferase 3 n=1 Tax=Sesamum calycinum TaxID=2727403 RepID=A0AAW2MCS4_9LAMI
MVLDVFGRDDKAMETCLFFDIALIPYVSGQERTEKEWAKLFFDAGFTGYKIIPAFGLRSVRVALIAKMKLSFIDGTYLKPAENTEELDERQDTTEQARVPMQFALVTRLSDSSQLPFVFSHDHLLDEDTVTLHTIPVLMPSSSPDHVDFPLPDIPSVDGFLAPTLRRSSRQITKPCWLNDFVRSSTHFGSGPPTVTSIAPSHSAFTASISMLHEPKTYQQASSSPEWKTVMKA